MRRTRLPAQATAIVTPLGRARTARPPRLTREEGSEAPATRSRFQEGQIEAQKAREKEKQAQDQAEAKQQNCESARNALRALESGQRISRVGKDGERYYLDEQQTAQETERAREVVQKNCTT